MSKERLEEANEWLVDMKRLLSSKTEVEDIEYMKKRIDLFEWMRSEIYRLYGGETFEGYIEQNKRYREALLDVREELNTSMSMSVGEYNSVEIIDEALEESE